MWKSYVHEIILMLELIILAGLLVYFGHQAINQSTPNQVTVQIVTGLLVAFGAATVSIGTLATAGIIAKKNDNSNQPH